MARERQQAARDALDDEINHNRHTSTPPLAA
jgi:hypothetical protein